MSWSKTYTGVTRENINAVLVPDVDESQHEQFQIAAKCAAEMIHSGVVGADGVVFNVTLGGHVNLSPLPEETEDTPKPQATVLGGSSVYVTVAQA